MNRQDYEEAERERRLRAEGAYGDPLFRDRTRESQGYSYGSREYNYEGDPQELPPYSQRHSREAERQSHDYQRIERRYAPGYGGNTAIGPHTGRGPRNYRRRDERICDDVCELLTRHGQIDAGDIEVSVENGEVTLNGTVDSRRTKRLAEDVADQVRGVRDVHNRLQVRQHSPGEQPRR